VILKTQDPRGSPWLLWQLFVILLLWWWLHSVCCHWRCS